MATDCLGYQHDNQKPSLSSCEASKNCCNGLSKKFARNIAEMDFAFVLFWLNGDEFRKSLKKYKIFQI